MVRGVAICGEEHVEVLFTLVWFLVFGKRDALVEPRKAENRGVARLPCASEYQYIFSKLVQWFGILGGYIPIQGFYVNLTLVNT